jgi:hypothetical protein
MAVETQFGAAGAFEREAAISMIVRHLLDHRWAYHVPRLRRRQTRQALGGASRSAARPTYAAWSNGLGFALH